MSQMCFVLHEPLARGLQGRGLCSRHPLRLRLAHMQFPLCSFQAALCSCCLLLQYRSGCRAAVLPGLASEKSLAVAMIATCSSGFCTRDTLRHACFTASSLDCCRHSTRERYLPSSSAPSM